jgi:hypothetical protein
LLDVHHIISVRESNDNSERNLISLCLAHHRWAENHLDLSIPMFHKIIESIYTETTQ